MLHASFALKDSHIVHVPVIIHYWFYWGPTTDVWIFTYLWIIITEFQLKAIWPMRIKNDWSRDIVWDGFLELNWWQHHILGDKVTVSVILTSKQSLYEVWQLDQTVVIDGAEEYRVEPGSGRNAGDQTNIFLVDGGRRSKLKSWRVHVKDRFQVAICEPVWVDDDGDIFGRQRTNGTDRIVR